MSNDGQLASASPPLTIAQVLKDEQSITKLEGAASNLPVGLALSGGGIRSATFALGVLQALARKEKLAAFDYLSTVSGGGYIGSFLSAWIYRTSVDDVQKDLARQGVDNTDGMKANEPEQITWLRRYSNYLTPKVGLFSVDSATLISIWTRNFLLSLITLLALLETLLLIPRLLVPLIQELIVNREAVGQAAAFFGVVFFPLGIIFNFLHLSRLSDQREYWLITTLGVFSTVILPAIVGALSGSVWLFGNGLDPVGELSNIFGHTLLILAIPGVVWLSWEIFRERRWAIISESVIFAFAATMSVGVAFALLGAIRFALKFYIGLGDPAGLLTIGPPAFLLIFGICGSIYVGLVGRVFFEPTREWWSRLNAWLFIIGLCWLILMSSAFYLPPIFDWLNASDHKWIAKLGGAGWVISIASTFSANAIKKLTKTAQRNVFKVVNIAAIIVLLGMIIAVSVGTERVLVHVTNFTMTDDFDTAIFNTPPNKGDELSAFIQWHVNKSELFMAESAWGRAAQTIYAGLVACVLLLFGWRADVNKFSLHNMYKNRLIRCYLGASNLRPNHHPFIGFDKADDFPLEALSEQRPLHIFNTALNLSQGRNLAWQERKAASFIFTPRFCGYSLSGTQGDTTISQIESSSDGQSVRILGSTDPELNAIPAFRPTNEYAQVDDEERGFSIGMAMATSGAAASPNMGSQTSPALAFVMTLLNVRLGRWSANPSQRQWRFGTPKFGLWCLLQELFGVSNEISDYVYLSDGGHFDNMGLYELVRRRCGVIWLVDASADPKRTFSDLGRSIRLCRVDLGVEISLPLDALRVQAGDQFPREGFVAGKISYGDGTEGKIIYIKPTICTDRAEPNDVAAYADQNPSFPHQTTGDQFFEESQFESYRRLGIHIGERCLNAHSATLPSLQPSKVLVPKNAAVYKKPHSTLWWLITVFLISVLIGVALSVFRASLMPYAQSHIDPLDGIRMPIENSSDSYKNDFRCDAIALMSEGVIELPECAENTDRLQSAISKVASPTHLTLLGTRLPKATEVWLLIDNIWIVSYSGVFILGYVLLKLTLRRSAGDKWKMAWLIKLILLPIFMGAFFDYLENFQLLGGFGADNATIIKIAGNLWRITTIKFILFFANLVVFICGFIAVYYLKPRR